MQVTKETLIDMLVKNWNWHAFHNMLSQLGVQIETTFVTDDIILDILGFPKAEFTGRTKINRDCLIDMLYADIPARGALVRAAAGRTIDKLIEEAKKPIYTA